MQLVIFDCDGVLRSVSWEFLYKAYLEIFKFINKNPDDFFQGFEGFRKWFNSDWQENLESIGIPRGSNTAVINRIFHEIYDPAVYLFPWVGDVLRILSKKHRLALLSASSSESVKRSLDGNSHFFEMIVGYEHVKNLKPHPEGIHLIMEKFQAKPSETIMIGDADVDILAGRGAGTRTAGVTWGLSYPEEIEALNPDLLFKHPEELFCL